MWKLIVLSGIFIAALADGRQDEIRVLQPRSSPSDLRNALFQNYDPKALPVLGPDQIVPVTGALAPIYIREVDEEKEIIVMDAWIQMTWVDKHLTWNPASYSGIELLNVPSHDVWKPDISTYSTSPAEKLVPDVFTNVILNHTGGVMWVPPLTISSRCPLDFTNFPKDVQQCEIILGSWTFGSRSIDLQLTSNVVELNDFQDNNPEWSLEEATVFRIDKYYPCCPDESYPSLHYNVTLKRKLSSAVHIADTVATFSVLLAMVMFLLPPDSTVKVFLGVIAEIFLGLIALYVGAVVEAPEAKIKASERLYPFMSIVAVFILFEVITLNIARVMGPCRPPKWLLTTCRSFCMPFGVCASKKYDELGDGNAKHSTTVREDWNVIAMALDRILFFIAMVLTVFFYKLL